MIAILFCVFWAINVILVIIKKKSKLITLLTFAVMVTIYFLNTTSGDYENYLWEYNTSSYYTVESGFTWIMKIASSCSLSFNQFQGIVCTISLLLVFYVFKHYSENYHLFFSVYFIYQYFYDIDSLKNFLARAILLLAIYMLIEGKRKHFIFTLLIGLLIHRTLIIYLPLALFNPERGFSRKSMKYCSIAVVVLCFVIFVLHSRFEFLGSFLMVALERDNLNAKLNTYLTRSTQFGFLIYFVLHACDIFLVWRSKRFSEFVGEEQTDRLCQFTWFINLYVVMFFPLIMINNVFFRLFNNIILLNFILYSRIADSYEKTTTRYYRYVFVIILFMLLYRLSFVHSSAELTRILGGLL